MWEYLNLVQAFINEEHSEDLKNDFITPLKKSIEHLQAALMFFMQNGLKNPLRLFLEPIIFALGWISFSQGFIWSKKAQSVKRS